MHRITPLQLRILIDLYPTAVQPDLPSTTHCDQFHELINSDMIGHSDEREYFITERGEAYVHHILSTPFPEKQYVVIRDDEVRDGLYDG